MLPVLLLTCPERAAECAETLADWALTDWGEPPRVFCNPDRSEHIPHRIVAGFRALLQLGLVTGAERFLLLEDDLRFHRHLRARLAAWPPLPRLHLGLLYHYGLPAVARFPAENTLHADPRHCRGAQARLFSRPFAEHCLAHLAFSHLKQDEQIARLCDPARFGPIHVHTPSLVQHVGAHSTWGGLFHQALDFST